MSVLSNRIKRIERKRTTPQHPHVIVCGIGQSEQEAIAAYHATHPDFNPHDEDGILLIVRKVVG
ncbi:MAG: hypothetical protein EAZ74_01430 [Alphaproteobacteria bacterium]|nr:MAG: hypothetical protein EAY76_04965 [Alphaproteobacteria bacterium]TAF15585.1 MAG: hypothetical protein EAZ74_01430 [Alphaproteobacteria bacterium]TAF41989.1 MAG: hypothetical protein EAZ66_00175 [Alphaproteobacteria bacterium]TAF76597.1 MAG: hypothetical protein EAZ52_03470 [Alphaproteobacteria bacterium]